MSCSCQPGYMGPLCEQDVDECLDDTVMCVNGTCVNTAGSFNCDCNDGYEGDLCELPSGSASAATGGGGLSTTVVAMIGYVAAALVLTALFVFYRIRKRRSKKRQRDRKSDKKVDSDKAEDTGKKGQEASEHSISEYTYSGSEIFETEV